MKRIWLPLIVLVSSILISIPAISQFQTDIEIRLNFNQENKVFELESLKGGYPISEKETGYAIDRTKSTLFKPEKFTIKNTEGNFEIVLKDSESLFKEVKEVTIHNFEGKRYLNLKLNRKLNLGLENDEELKIPLIFGQKIYISNPRKDIIDIKIELPRGKTRTYANPYLVTEELSEDEKKKIKFETIPLGSYELFSNLMEDLNRQDIDDLGDEKVVEKNVNFISDKRGRSYIDSFGLRLSKEHGNYYFFKSTKKITGEVKFKLKETIKEETMDDLKFPEGKTGVVIIQENLLLPLSIPKETLLKIREENRIRNSVTHNKEINAITEEDTSKEQLKGISENKDKLKPK